MTSRRLQNSKAIQRVERLIFDAVLEGEWRSSGDVLETELRADPLAADR